MDIEFTQYVLPDGRRKPVLIDRPDDVAQKARRIMDAGHRFECEILTTGEVSLTIHNIEDEEDVDIEVVPNGPEVPVAIDRMIERFAALSREGE